MNSSSGKIGGEEYIILNDDESTPKDSPEWIVNVNGHSRDIEVFHNHPWDQTDAYRCGTPMRWTEGNPKPATQCLRCNKYVPQDIMILANNVQDLYR